MSAAIDWPKGAEPAVSLEDMTHPERQDATVTWPTGNGPVTLAGLVPGGTA